MDCTSPLPVKAAMFRKLLKAFQQRALTAMQKMTLMPVASLSRVRVATRPLAGTGLRLIIAEIRSSISPVHMPNLDAMHATHRKMSKVQNYQLHVSLAIKSGTYTAVHLEMIAHVAIRQQLSKKPSFVNEFLTSPLYFSRIHLCVIVTCVCQDFVSKPLACLRLVSCVKCESFEVVARGAWGNFWTVNINP
jgi:hypothetical protein